MSDLTKLTTLKDVEDNYDIFLIDLWGVIHNGLELFENVKSVLARLKKKNKIIFFITNAPRRSVVIANQLNHFGLSNEFYDHIVSSGEITWLSLKKNYEKKKMFFNWATQRLSFG